jgi:hypothetical protein
MLKSIGHLRRQFGLPKDLADSSRQRAGIIGEWLQTEAHDLACLPLMFSRKRSLTIDHVCRGLPHSNSLQTILGLIKSCIPLSSP